MIVNRYDKKASFAFLAGLNKRLESDKFLGMKKSSAIRMSDVELETIIDIVKLQENFCLHFFDYINNIDGFSVYNINGHIGSLTKPLVQFTELNAHNPAYLSQLRDVASDTRNTVKLGLLGMKPKSCYTESGMPKYYHGMKLMTGI